MQFDTIMNYFEILHGTIYCKYHGEFRFIWILLCQWGDWENVPINLKSFNISKYHGIMIIYHHSAFCKGTSHTMKPKQKLFENLSWTYSTSLYRCQRLSELSV